MLPSDNKVPKPRVVRGVLTQQPPLHSSPLPLLCQVWKCWDVNPTWDWVVQTSGEAKSEGCSDPPGSVLRVTSFNNISTIACQHNWYNNSITGYPSGNQHFSVQPFGAELSEEIMEIFQLYGHVFCVTFFMLHLQWVILSTALGTINLAGSYHS